MKKKLPIIIFLIVLIGLIAGFIVYINSDNMHISKVLTIHEEGADVSGIKDDYFVEYKPGKTWDQDHVAIGGVYEFVIHNESSFDITEWSCELMVDDKCEMDDAWDCIKPDRKPVNGKYVLHCADYNRSFPSKTTRKVGFVLYSPTAPDFSTMTFIADVNFEPGKSTAFVAFIAVIVFWVLSFFCYLLFILRVRRFKMLRERDRKIIDQSIQTFINFIDAKDVYTRGHSNRVARYSREIAKRLQFSDDEIENIYYVALLHDVGKVSIPDEILNKNARLTDEEFEIIKNHTIKGADMLKSFVSIPGIIDGALYHHERYDGKGYPSGMKGVSIPLIGRIICVADSYDAMSSNRCYRKKLDDEEILKELNNNAGTQFDPAIVSHMVDMIQDGTAARIQMEYNSSIENEQ